MSPATDRPDPPHNRAAEEAVVGSLLLGGREAFSAIRDGLDVADFFVPQLATIFSATATLAAHEIAIDLTTVGDALQRSGDFERIGGALELTRLLERVPSAANIVNHAAIVRERSELRCLVRCAALMHEGAMSLRPVAEIRRDALKVLEAAASPSSSFAYLNLDKIAANGIPPIDWLVPGWIERGDVAIVGGPAYSGKTTTMAAFAIALASGHPWCGITPATTGPVLWFDEEAGEAQTARLFLRLGANGVRDLSVASGQGVNVASSDGFARLEREIAKVRPLLVVLDSATQVFGGIDENSAEQVGPVFGRLFRLRDKYGVTFVILHHLKKPGEVKVDLLTLLRGSTAWATQASTVWVAQRVDDVTIDLIQVKRRGTTPTSLRVTYHEEGRDGPIALTGGPRTTPAEEKAAGLRQRVLDELTKAGEAGLTRDQVKDRVTGSDADILGTLNALRDDGEVRQNGVSRPLHPARFVRSFVPPFRGGERKNGVEAHSVPASQNGAERKNGVAADDASEAVP